MQTSIYFNTLTEQMLRDAAFGLGFLAVILLINVFLVLHIYLHFKKYCAVNEQLSAFNVTNRFMIAILLICLVQILSIHLWALWIYGAGLINDPLKAVLFAGSCYTTLGIYSDILPKGWEVVALYIAFSGLFSFAMSTSAMISMLTLGSERFTQPKPPKQKNLSPENNRIQT